jgi:hypothetical protein
MAIDATKALPFGIRDIKLTPLGADGKTPGTKVDLPLGRTLGFTEAEDYTELRGDDGLAATHGSGPHVEWSLESGGISLEALVVLDGGAITQTGTTPNVIKTYSKKVTDGRNYFKMEGQAISDNGGDFHTVVYRCKTTGNISGEFADGAFFVTSCDGRGLGSLEAGSLDKLYDFVHNETVTAIP